MWDLNLLFELLPSIYPLISILRIRICWMSILSTKYQRRTVKKKLLLSKPKSELLTELPVLRHGYRAWNIPNQTNIPASLGNTG